MIEMLSLERLCDYITILILAGSISAMDPGLVSESLNWQFTTLLLCALTLLSKNM